MALSKVTPKIFHYLDKKMHPLTSKKLDNRAVRTAAPDRRKWAGVELRAGPGPGP